MKEYIIAALLILTGFTYYASSVEINPGDTHTVNQTFTCSETVTCASCPVPPACDSCCPACPACPPDRFPNAKIVDPSGNGDYTTIQDAVNNSVANEVIFVKTGTYNRAIKIYNDGLQLVEFPGNDAVIDFTDSPDAIDRIEIHGDNVRVEGFEITNGYEGIKIYGNNSQIRDNYIHDNRGQGILVVNSSGHSIRSNRLINNGTGCSSPRHCHEIYFSNYQCQHASSNNEVKYNRLENSGGSGVQFNGLDEAIGICPQKFLNNDISYNKFINNAIGITLYYNVENSDIRNNEFIVDRDIRAETNQSEVAHLAFWGSQNNDIKDNTFFSDQKWETSGQPKGVGAMKINDSTSMVNNVDRNRWNINRQWWSWNGWRGDFNGAYKGATGWDANGYVFIPVGTW